jgi:hypothetical protein
MFLLGVFWFAHAVTPATPPASCSNGACGLPIHFETAFAGLNLK